MIYFAFMILLSLTIVGALVFAGHTYVANKALEPDEADQKIIEALTDGTLTDADLEGIGIDVKAFRAKYKAALKPKSKLQKVREFARVVPRRAIGDVSISINGLNLEIRTPQGQLSIGNGKAQPPLPPIPPIAPMAPMLPMQPMSPVLPDANDAREYAREMREWQRECEQVRRDHTRVLRDHERIAERQQRDHERAMQNYERGRTS